MSRSRSYAHPDNRYGEAFEKMGLKLYSGDGGFYHWCRTVDGLTTEELIQRLFKHGAAILKGSDCDMARQGDQSPLRNFFRFSFGPLPPEAFERDVALLEAALRY